MADVGDKLKKLMADKNVTAYRVAKEIGYSETAVHAWLDGDYVPKGNALMKLSKFFGVSMEHFISD